MTKVITNNNNNKSISAAKHLKIGTQTNYEYVSKTFIPQKFNIGDKVTVDFEVYNNNSDDSDSDSEDSQTRDSFSLIPFTGSILKQMPYGCFQIHFDDGDITVVSKERMKLIPSLDEIVKRKNHRIDHLQKQLDIQKGIFRSDPNYCFSENKQISNNMFALLLKKSPLSSGIIAFIEETSLNTLKTLMNQEVITSNDSVDVINSDLSKIAIMANALKLCHLSERPIVKFCPQMTSQYFDGMIRNDENKLNDKYRGIFLDYCCRAQGYAIQDIILLFTKKMLMHNAVFAVSFSLRGKKREEEKERIFNLLREIASKNQYNLLCNVDVFNQDVLKGDNNMNYYKNMVFFSFIVQKN